MSNFNKQEQKFECKCGRKFHHQISMDRHLRTSGCGNEEASEEAASEAADVFEERESETPLSEDLEAALKPEPTNDELPAFEVAQDPDPVERAVDTMAEFMLWLVENGYRAGRGAPAALASAGLVLGQILARAALVLAVLMLGFSLAVLLSAPRRALSPPAPAAAAVQQSASAPQERSRQTVSPGPEQFVEHFYSLVDRGSLGGGYARLSPRWQRELSYARFEDGYSHTSQVRCQVLGSHRLGGDQVRVDFALEVTEGGRRVRYRGYHLVTRGGEGWELDGGLLEARTGEFENGTVSDRTSRVKS